jgi:hypothetical protein
MAAALMPGYDIPYICPECLRQYGDKPAKGLFPEASISAFTFRGTPDKIWRIFNCCADQGAQNRASFSKVSNNYQVFWQRKRPQ